MATGVGANRGGRKVTEMEIDYYLTEDKHTAPSLKLRQRNELTRQRTSDNRLHELHLSAFPHPLNDVLVLNAEEFKTFNSPRQRTVASEDKSYPAMRSTYHVFNDAVIQAKKGLSVSSPRIHLVSTSSNDEASLALLPPHLRYVASYNRDWSEEDKVNVRAARKLPFDSTIPNVVGRPKSIYRDDFCRKAQIQDYRDQVLLGASSSATTSDSSETAAPPADSVSKQGTNGNTLTTRVPSAPTMRVVKVGSNDCSQDAPNVSWFAAATGHLPATTPKRCFSARQDASAAAHPPKPRAPASPRKLEVCTARKARQPDEDFLLYPQSYFTNRARYTLT